MSYLTQITDKTVGLIVLAALVPVGLGALFAVNMSEWDPATIAIFGIIGILFIVSLVKLIL
jgi:hypothetical protein